MRNLNNNAEIQFSLYNEALILIEEKCLSIVNKSLNQLGMVVPNRIVEEIYDRDLYREHQYV